MQKQNLKIDRLFACYYPVFSILFGLICKFCFSQNARFPYFFVGFVYFAIKTIPILQRKQVFIAGFLVGIGYFGSTLFWIEEAFGCVGMGFFGYPAVFILVLYLSIYPGLAFLFTKIFHKNETTLAILLSVFWVLFEYLRGIIFTGFPWNLIGYIALDVPYFAQSADLFGVYGLSFIIMLITSFLFNKKTAIFGIILFVANISYGYYMIVVYDGYKISKNHNMITIVQPSIPQNEKMDREKFRMNLEKHIIMSEFDDAYRGKRLVIWSEAAVPLTRNREEVLSFIAHFIKQKHTFICAGIDRIAKDREIFNSFVVVGKDNNEYQVYDKRHLLPFGEYIPNFLEYFGLKKLTQGALNFSKGRVTRTIKIEGFEQFEVLICFETAFPGEIMDSNKSTWILNISNDSWFKKTDGPYQHLSTVRMRAIEEGRCVMRCANNGISAIINANGAVLKALHTDQIGIINTQAPLKYRNTAFQKWHNKPVLLIAIVAFLYIAFKTRWSAKTPAVLFFVAKVARFLLSQIRLFRELFR